MSVATEEPPPKIDGSTFDGASNRFLRYNLISSTGLTILGSAIVAMEGTYTSGLDLFNRTTFTGGVIFTISGISAVAGGFGGLILERASRAAADVFPRITRPQVQFGPRLHLLGEPENMISPWAWIGSLSANAAAAVVITWLTGHSGAIANNQVAKVLSMPGVEVAMASHETLPQPQPRLPAYVRLIAAVKPKDLIYNA